MSARFGKRPPRLQFLSARAEPVYFVTFCTHKRQPWLANAAVHDSFIAFAQRAAHEFNVSVGRYVIMPEHVHLFVCGDPRFVLGRWIGQLKQALARAAPERKRDNQPWQEGFFDHVLRSDESYDAKWDYVRSNPMRAGLVRTPDEWPFQGAIVRIDRA